MTFTAPPDREARLESRGITLASAARPPRPKGGGMEGAVVRLQSSLDRWSASRSWRSRRWKKASRHKARRMRGVLGDLGLDVPKNTPAPRGGVGGPYLPVKPGDSNAFERQLYRINVSRARSTSCARRWCRFPIASRSSVRSKQHRASASVPIPFLGRTAMHSGLDFRGSTGDPVRATAAGKVVAAGWSGGYGRMIEIEHNDQLSTRYGHLSQINVKVGDADQDRPGHRRNRLDRPFDRSASAL